GDVVGMLAPDRLARLQPVAEALAQHGDGRGDTVGAALARCLPRRFHLLPLLGPSFGPCAGSRHRARTARGTMFTQSCCDVTVASLAVQHKQSDSRSSKQIAAGRAA